MRTHDVVNCLAAVATLIACYGGSANSTDTARATAKTGSISETATGVVNDSAKADASTQPGNAELAGTSWRLVEIQSMADSTFTPSDRSRYTISFGTDGRASMRVDCNRGSASWTSTVPGQLTFGQAAMTRAMCPPGSLYDRFVRDLAFVRTYVLKDGKLHLATMADGAIYEFEPLPASPPPRD